MLFTVIFDFAMAIEKKKFKRLVKNNIYDYYN